MNNQRYHTFFCDFHPVNLILTKNNNSLEHLNVLLCIFFMSCVVNKFDVHFWSLLSWKRRYRKAEKKIPLNFTFYDRYESINFCSAGIIKITLIVTPFYIHNVHVSIR